MSEPASQPDSAVDRLIKEYARAFQAFDDLTLARWCAQTLGQLCGGAWRSSHPLVGAYKLAAQVAHERRLWSQRLVNIPHGYPISPCCRAPFLPLLTRDVVEQGLVCQHCQETLVPMAEVPEEIRPDLQRWADEYDPVHEVAHWDDKRQSAKDFDSEFEAAAQRAEELLGLVATDLAPRLLDHYPAVIWEDQDECLEVRPEDVDC